MQEKLLSVIIPAYNLENYIEECVNSVRNQTYKNLQIIIVDDGSSDGTLDICQRLARDDERIVVVSQKNAGVTMARDKGLSLACGEYVAFVDGDDYLEADMYRCMMEKAENNDMVACGFYHHISKTRVQKCFDGFEGSYHSKEKLQEVWGKMLYDFKTGKANVVSPSLWNKVFKRSLAKSMMQKIRTDIFYAEDAIFVYQYLLECKSIYFLRIPFYHYRYREESVCHSRNERMLQNTNQVYLELRKVFEQYDIKDVLLAQLEKTIVLMTINVLNQYMGFSMDFRIPKFVIDVENLRKTSLVLYGAGKMGQDVRYQLMNEGIPPIAWLDRDYEVFRSQGLNVDSPDILNDLKFDVLLIAVTDKDLANKITDDVIQKGVSREKIIWEKPIRVY